MSITVRPIGEAEWPDFVAVAYEAFSSTYPLEITDRWREIMEFDRLVAAFDDDLAVGCAGTLSFHMTVPGGPIPVAGVTAVGVLSSHRRRGVLTALMTHQLHGLHHRGGEAVAALYASEAGIYGRFGYGRASDALSFRIPTHAAFTRAAPADATLRLRLARPADALAALRRVYDAVQPGRPGLYGRSEAFWRAEILPDTDYDQGGMGPLRCLIAEDAAGPRGYALFRAKSGWNEHGVADGEVRLMELHACDPAAYALVWRGVLDRDLCAVVHAGRRPSDDAIVHLLAEPRQASAVWIDDLWVRLVDVDRALAARAYAAPADLVVEVEDEVCPWNAGRWRLKTAGGAESCERSEAPADLTMPVGVLGAAYLGGRPLSAAAEAGLVREHRAGALRELSAAMSWDPAPWGCRVF
ncbi:GNAT family N-acetyltransferase [Microbispora sp. H11081]|uniref:GNAT family N-acetyltransferase n=1 Tax=Microbispora sp. H11081 TaxID=2729107 RepID=UPI0014755AB5|nr:GNAT family N-acetyltransferase [Microbispora sp. H11081]